MNASHTDAALTPSVGGCCAVRVWLCVSAELKMISMTCR
jgi:hypothetical protein